MKIKSQHSGSWGLVRSQAVLDSLPWQPPRAFYLGEYKMIKPITTIAFGHKFRSRLEARWATFFSSLNIPWEYEKEGYDLDGEYYLPDFYLPTVGLRRDINSLGLWVEIKPAEDEETEKSKENKKYFKLAGYTNHPLILYYGLPDFESYHGYEYSAEMWDNCMIFCKCYLCGYIRVEFAEGNYMYCPKCNANSDNDHPAILRAVNAAKQARFEHGEKG